MIHVLMLNWNGEEHLKKLYPGLKKNLDNCGQEYNILIKDNGSKDNSISIIKEWNDPFVKVYPTGHNRDNYAAGMNFLAKKAFVVSDFKDLNIKSNNDYILLLNNDIEFIDDCSIKNMLKLFNENVGMVGCKLYYPNTIKLQHAGVIFGEKYNKLPYHYRHGEESKDANKNRKFQAVTAAVCIAKASVFVKVNGFSEEFNWAYDDIDLCLKINKQLKQDIIYCGNTNIYHGESLTLKKNPVHKLFQDQNVKLFREKWSGKYQIDHEFYLKDPNYLLV